ncbi:MULTISPECIES: enoyl-CoA hydratase [unclassified Virgibacillus]|uniref:enoyl-CoA hydratase n=1 Tax=unclassified Virgibacillus TaxID=2620237 RepID=UPI0024DEF4DC|nr:enoyl-CoA hydratase [Virgibacillus sp. LDC-1]
MLSTVDYKQDGSIAILTIQSPPANALSSSLLSDLNKKLDAIENNGVAKAIILRGDGKFFSAGADIKEFTSLQNSLDYEALSRSGQEIFSRIEHFSIPVIAAIHGAALGGGLELAMACHIRIAEENTKLGLPELNLGIIPGFAGTQRLPQYVGMAKAYEMILSGEPISGKEAAQFGLVNQTVDTGEAFHEASKLATKFAAKSKASIHRIMQLLPYAKTSRFDEGAKAEAHLFGEIFGSADAKEGIQAFMEKRKPNFKD